MGKRVKCGSSFVGTPEQPPADGLCKYCEIQQLKESNDQLRKVCDELAVCLERRTNADIYSEASEALKAYNALPHILERNKSK